LEEARQLSLPVKCPDLVWGPHRCLFIGLKGFFSWGVRLTIHLHVVLRLRVSAAIPLLPL